MYKKIESPAPNQLEEELQFECHIVMRRFIKLTAVWVVLLAVSAKWWLPLFVREFALKRSMKINQYSERTDIPKECPSFESIAHESVLNKKFDYQKYNGV